MQLSFGDGEYAGKRKKTRREIFLAEMEQVVPWSALLKLIAPHYPALGQRGRQPYALATMLRIHFRRFTVSSGHHSRLSPSGYSCSPPRWK